MTNPRSVEITLSLPPKALSPNARVHWAEKYKITRAYRQQAAYLTRIVIGKVFDWKPPQWKHATAKMTFYFKDPWRRRDPDNLGASMKAGVDGIVDAGLLKDDSGLRHEPVEIDKAGDKMNPRVVIEIVRGD